MAEPDYKSEMVDAVILGMTGIDRKAHIQEDICVFCKKKVVPLTAAGKEEYLRSGICEKCFADV